MKAAERNLSPGCGLTVATLEPWQLDKSSRHRPPRAHPLAPVPVIDGWVVRGVVVVEVRGDGEGAPPPTALAHHPYEWVLGYVRFCGQIPIHFWFDY